MAQAQLWLKTLRQAVKGDYGPGWILKEQYDRFKIGRAEAGNARHGKTQFVSTDLPFARGSHRKVLNLIGEMVAKMQDPELNVGLAEAYELVRGSTEVTGAAINWEEVRSRYKASRVDSGTVKASNYAEHEEYRINRAFALITARTGAAHDGGGLMRLYARKHLMEVEPGSSGRKRNLLDVARFLKFAVNKCGADRKWLPLEADDLKELIGHRQTAPKPTVPIKPEELITLLNGLESDPSLRLAVGLVALFGLRPAELMVLSVDDGNLKIGNVKRNAHSSATPKPPRTVQELPLKELQGEGARLVQLFHSGLVKLPKSIRNLEAGAFKACGHTFRQYLDRNATWQSLKASNPELTPYSLRHGYAWRAAKYYPQPLPLRDTAKLMGHDLKTHIRHYGQWTDDASTKSAVEASIKSLVGAS